jgi:hypothetical protein
MPTITEWCLPRNLGAISLCFVKLTGITANPSEKGIEPTPTASNRLPTQLLNQKASSVYNILVATRSDS